MTDLSDRTELVFSGYWRVLPKDADPAATTLEQAVELLRARAVAGPAKRPARKAGGARKATKASKATKATKATKASKSTKKKA